MCQGNEFPGDDIGADGDERDGEAREIAACDIVGSCGQACKQRRQFLRSGESLWDVGRDAVEADGDEVSIMIEPSRLEHSRARGPVGEDFGEVDFSDQFREFIRGISASIEAADNASHRGSSDTAHRNVFFFERFEDADGGESSSAASRERQEDRVFECIVMWVEAVESANSDPIIGSKCGCDQ